MNENGEPLPPPDDDRTPTQADAPPPGKGERWVMPEPVFRKSTGYLPKSVEERFRQTLHENALDNAETPSAESDIGPPETVAGEIAAQPDLGDDATLDAKQPNEIAPKKKGGILRILLIILGLLLGAAVIIAIVAAGAIWYFSQTSESQNFN